MDASCAARLSRAPPSCGDGRRRAHVSAEGAPAVARDPPFHSLLALGRVPPNMAAPLPLIRQARACSLLAACSALSLAM
eukprot:1701626-Prymnesium_polylepis.1